MFDEVFVEKFKKLMVPIIGSHGCKTLVNTTTKRYVYVRYRGARYKGHRASYEIFKGLIPDEYVVRHSCTNKNCVNPEHLSVGTQKDNVLDYVASQRYKGLRWCGILKNWIK